MADYSLLLCNIMEYLYDHSDQYPDKGAVFYTKRYGNAYTGPGGTKSIKSSLYDLIKKRTEETPFLKTGTYSKLLNIYDKKEKIKSKQERLSLTQPLFMAVHLGGWMPYNGWGSELCSDLFNDNGDHGKLKMRRDFLNDVSHWGYYCKDEKPTIVRISNGNNSSGEYKPITEYIVFRNYGLIQDFCPGSRREHLKEIIADFCKKMPGAKLQKEDKHEHISEEGDSNNSLIPEETSVFSLLCEYLNSIMAEYDRASENEKNLLLARALTWLIFGATLRENLTESFLDEYLKPYVTSSIQIIKPKYPDSEKKKISYVPTSNPSSTELIGRENDTDTVKVLREYLEPFVTISRQIIKSEYPDPEKKETPYALTNILPSIELIGRENDTNAVKKLLDENSIVCIHANGGVGKTALAYRIINDVKKDMLSDKHRYEFVAWITSTGNLKKDICCLDIPAIKSVKTDDEKYREYCHFLTNNDVFLVIDNMDDFPKKDEISQLNTLAWKTRILITTRLDMPDFISYDLKNLEMDEALKLFYSHYLRWKGLNSLTTDVIHGRHDYKYAKRIIESSSFNTLFVELIAKMAYLDRWKLDDLQRRLEKDAFSQNSKHEIPTNHACEHDTGGKLLAQIRELYKMSKLSDRQKEIMEFLSLFPAEHSIFFDIFEWAGFYDDEEDNFGALQDRGWIERDDEGYLIHALVKGSVTLQGGSTKTDIKKYKTLIKELANTEQYIPPVMEYNRVNERAMILETVCGLLNESDDIETAALFKSLAMVNQEQNHFEEALNYYVKALAIIEKRLGTEDPETAKLFNDLAKVYFFQSRYEEALEYCNKACVIQEKLLGTDHLDTAKTYNNLAMLYRDLSRFKESLEYCNKTLAIIESNLGTKNPLTAKMYNNIGNIYMDEGYYEKAKDYYSKALSIKKELLGEEHPFTAGTYNNLAKVYQALGRYETALEYCKNSLAIREKLFGTDNPDTARTYHNLAEIYHALNRNEEALEYYNKALDIREKQLGMDHSSTAETYNDIGTVYKDMGNNEKALKYLQKALSVMVKKVGKDHISTAWIYYNLADVFHAKGDNNKAMKYYEKALSVYQSSFGNDHPRTRIIRQKLDDLKEH